MKILITGAGGFIGSHLVDDLVSHGHQVRALDLHWPQMTDPRPEVDRILGDVTQAEDCQNAVRGCSHVCHLAARVGDWGPARAYMDVNVGGTRKLLQAAEQSDVQRFLLVSSVAVHHYRGLRQADETSPRDGHINAYCRSKIAAEDLLFASSSSLEWTIVRPGVFPFGPRDRTTFLPLAAELERGRGGYIRGGRALITTAYVENLTQGLRLALERPEGAGETFVIGDDGEVTWRQLFSSFAEGLGVRPPRLSLPFPLAYAVAWAWEGIYSLFRVQRAPLLTRYRSLLAGRDCHFVSTKAKRLLGYEPTIDLEEAVTRTARWYHDLRPH